MREVSPGVYVETGFQGGNVGLILTGEGAVLIDTPMMPWEAREWARMIKRATDEKIRFVINTDHHTEHSLGNHFFAGTVIGHETGWKEIVGFSEAYRQRLIDSLQTGDAERDSELKGLTLVPPRLTLTDHLTLYLGDRILQLLHVGGHATSSMVVHLKREKVVFTGDVVVQGVQPILSQSNSREWLSALGRIRRISIDVLVPGQGEPGGKEMTVTVSEFIRSIRSGARKHYRAGQSKAETYNHLLELIHLFPVPESRRDRIEQQFKAGVSQVYEEIKAERGD
jgi:cyclase